MLSLKGGDILANLPLILASSLVSHYICSTFEPWPKHLFPAFLLTVSIIFYQVYQDTQSIWQSVFESLTIFSLYLTFLFASIAVYRLFFHRLCRFPGPQTYALSKWSMFLVDLNGQRFRKIDEAHQKYGDIVRTGPRELSINDASVYPAIYSSQSTCTKGPWYAGVAGGRPTDQRSVYELVDKRIHSQRRKIWDSAFCSISRNAHIRSIDSLMDKVLEKLKETSEKHSPKGFDLNISQYCTMFSFDVMGIIGFAKSFNLIENGEESLELRQLQAAVRKAQVVGNLPYISQALDWLPGNQVRIFKNWVRDAIRAREKAIENSQDFPMDKNESIDVMGHLIGSHRAARSTTSKEKQSIRERKLIAAEGMLLCVGGSDTTSAALTSIFYQLVKRPDIIQGIREEVSKIPKELDLPQRMNALRDKCPLLNASIKEAMRIFPPGLSGLQRETPKEGLILQVKGKEVYIPGNVVVSTPPFTINRDPINFSPSPLQFRPERWLESNEGEEEENFNAQACIPFGFGPTGCVGRELAKAEIRIFITRLISSYDLAFSYDFDTEEFEQDIRDLFTLHAHLPLRLRLTKRV